MFFLRSWQFLNSLCHLAQWSKFLSVFEYCQVSPFLLPILDFSILSCITHFCPYIWPYMIWSGSRLNLCQSHTGPHVSFWMLHFQKSELCESSSRIWQMLVRIDIPVIVNSFFLHDIQISMTGPSYINVFQWIREGFFLRRKVHCDDDRWRHLGVDQKSVRASESSVVFAEWDSPDSHWSSTLRSSLLTVESCLGVGSPNS